MKTKDEIKLEIFELAQNISRASSEKFLLETAREIYELAALLKHAPKDEAPAVVKSEEKPPVVAEEAAKPEAQPIKQATIDLFSSEVSETTTPSGATSGSPERGEQTPAALPLKGTTEGREQGSGGGQPAAEKPVQKEKKEPKQKTAESVAEKLQHNKITDLKSSIGINEKFQFINELFEGNMKEYNVAVDQINSFSSHSQAESYISNLETVYKWKPDNQIADNFKELVERRFA